MYYLVLLVLVVYYVRQNREGFESAEQCTVYAFVADWCPHCENATPAINNLQNNAPNNVNVEVVNEKDNNSRELMKKYGVKGFPTILLIKADGEVVEFEQRVTEENLNVFVANNANNVVTTLVTVPTMLSTTTVPLTVLTTMPTVLTTTTA